jgi:hypothetical protein
VLTLKFVPTLLRSKGKQAGVATYLQERGGTKFLDSEHE